MDQQITRPSRFGNIRNTKINKSRLLPVPKKEPSEESCSYSTTDWYSNSSTDSQDIEVSRSHIGLETENDDEHSSFSTIGNVDIRDAGVKQFKSFSPLLSLSSLEQSPAYSPIYDTSILEIEDENRKMDILTSTRMGEKMTIPETPEVSSIRGTKRKFRACDFMNQSDQSYENKGHMKSQLKPATYPPCPLTKPLAIIKRAARYDGWVVQKMVLKPKTLPSDPLFRRLPLIQNPNLNLEPK